MNDYATLRGLAVGDALGARFERIDGTRSLELTDWRGELLGGGDPRIWPKGRPAGGTTDDTAFALALAGSLIESRGYDRLHAAASYVKLLDEEPPGGLGPTLRTGGRRSSCGRASFATRTRCACASRRSSASAARSRLGAGPSTARSGEAARRLGTVVFRGASWATRRGGDAARTPSGASRRTGDGIIPRTSAQ